MKILDSIGNPAFSDWILIQPVDEHDQGMLETEISHIRERIPASFTLVPVRVDWFNDLTPWPAPATFKGQPNFGNGAEDTLHFIIDEIINELSGTKHILLGGYSLAGLFSLWAGYQTDAFEGIVAASPSVWYPGWDEYMANHRMRAPRVYLSLGDREDRTRNPVMKTVRDRITEQYAVCQSQGIQCTLIWNEGNHFRDPDKRTAAGFAWAMKAF